MAQESVPRKHGKSGRLHEHCTATNGVRLMMLGGCWAQLTSLAAKHPLRGGLEVGWGTTLMPSEVYGAGLVRAYKLESEIAEYPRVVMGSEILEYLDVVQRQHPTTLFGRNAIQTVEHCKRFLVRDNDGQFMLDFLGDAFREVASRVPGIEETIGDAYAFVRGTYDQFEAEGPPKLAGRYQRLKEYMEGRLEQWEKLED